jgi:hypothetical protein
MSLIPLLAAAALAHAAGAGSIVLFDHALDPASGTFQKDLKKSTKTSFKADADGNWHVYFVAYLNKPPGAPEINAVFYDVTKGKHEQINAFPIQTKADAKIVMSDLPISVEQGFKEGNKYQMLITRLVDGKEVVYAKTTVDLK